MATKKRSGGARAAGGARKRRRQRKVRRRYVRRPSPCDRTVEMPKPEGRPTEFRTEMVEQAQKLCEIGATDIEVAEFFGVTDRTIYRWKHEHADFAAAMRLGKEAPNERAKRTLYQRAVGFHMPAEKVFCDGGRVTRVRYLEYVQPDTTALRYYLNNRVPEEFRDRRELTGKDGEPLASVAPVLNVIIERDEDDEGGGGGPAPAPEAG